MFKKAILVTAITCAASPTFAADAEKEKHFSVGIASFATVVNVEAYAYNGYNLYYVDEDLEFSGFSIFGTAAINDNVGFRLAYADQSNDDDSDFELTAIEGSLIAGTGLTTTGFKAYGSAGFFNESLEVKGLSGEEDFNGLMLGAGIGYNWNPVSLEFWFHVRDASDYEDSFGDAEVVAVSGGLGLSARF